MLTAAKIVSLLFEQMEEGEWIEWHNNIKFLKDEMGDARKGPRPFDKNQMCKKEPKISRWEMIWKRPHNNVANIGQGYRLAVHDNDSKIDTLCQITDSLIVIPAANVNSSIGIIKNSRTDFFNHCKSSGCNHLHQMYLRVLVPIFPGSFAVLFRDYDCYSILNFLKKFPTAKPVTIPSDIIDKQIVLTDAVTDIFGAELDKHIADWDKNYPSEKLDRACLISIFPWFLLTNIINNSFQLHKQVVYTGPPGSGKTYLAEKKSENEIDMFISSSAFTGFPKTDFFKEFIQFHPSYGYEDFIEGIKPSGINSASGIGFTLQDGTLKSFCRKAGFLEILLAEAGIPIDETHTLIYVQNEVNKKGGWQAILNIYKKRRGGLFEQDIADFWLKYVLYLENIITSENTDTPDKSVQIEDESGQVHQNEKSFISWLPPFFLIIDEINRAELSRVFGELMYCLEYRGSQHKVRTQYATMMDSVPEHALIMQGGRSFFFIPHNLYIIGTMNDIDRSVETFDLALRRRFYWEEKKYNGTVLKRLLKEQNNKALDDSQIGELVKRADRLNAEISDEKKLGKQLGKDYQIGQAYYLKIFKYASGNDPFNALWKHHIQPILKEYVRGLPDNVSILNSLEKAFRLEND